MKKILIIFSLISYSSILYSQNIREDIDGEINIIDSYDEFTKMTWYEPEYIPDNEEERMDYVPDLYCYIGIQKSSKSNIKLLRLKTTYTDRNWLFIDTLYLLCDGDIKEIKINSKDIDSNVGSYGFISETIDILVDDNLMSFLEKLSQGKDVKMRYSGSKGNRDYIINTIDKKAIKMIIDKYKES